jgi:DNA-binding NarL/FixJ family response regulator
MAKTSILVADDHPIFRDGLRRLLNSLDDVEIVQETETVAETVATVLSLRPDLLLLDLALKDGSGFEVLARLRGEAPETLVVVVTGLGIENMAEAFRRGARGFVTKDTASADLLNAIGAVLAGNTWPEHPVMPPPPKLEKERQATEKLTPRERELLRLVGQGQRDGQIARSLSISEHTVKTHVASLMRKLGIDDRLKLALYASRVDANHL